MIYRKPYTSSQNGLSHTLKRKFSPIVGRLEKISSQNLPSNRERQYNLGLALFYHKEIKICLVGFRKSFNHRFSVSKDLSFFPPHWGTHQKPASSRTDSRGKYWYPGLPMSPHSIQLFRERLSEKVHVTIPKGIVGGFKFTLLQRNLKEWHERPWTYVCEC